MTILNHTLGFPRVGLRRELKKAQESYWAGNSTREELLAVGRELRARHWDQQKQAGIDLLPVGDFAWYDHVLTTSLLLGNVPQRHQNNDGSVDIDTLFRIGRGRAPTGEPAAAAEMTKWFNTNYHYMVPEFVKGQQFKLTWTQLLEEVDEALALGHKVKPVLLGPITYLWLGKVKGEQFDRLSLLNDILPVYQQVLAELAKRGIEWVQIDEPALVLELPQAWLNAYKPAYDALQGQVKLLLTTYFEGVTPNLDTITALPVQGLHVDLVHGKDDVAELHKRLPSDWLLSAGLINGRNVWRADLTEKYAQIKDIVGKRDLWVASSCSLLHSPIDLSVETRLDAEVKSWFAFALQKCHELALLRDALNSGDTAALAEWSAPIQARRHSTRVHNPAVEKRLAAITAQDSQRANVYEVRAEAQRARFKLPAWPTTTIGSFPQTTEIRTLRLDFKKGNLDANNYRTGIAEHIKQAIVEQERLGLDVLVHGEAERNDMVEYFGEHLDGFVFTQNGWVQSYGSRCVKPPIVIGDVSRPAPITVEWAKYAQSLTDKPVKGMLTGPVTILCWSFRVKMSAVKPSPNKLRWRCVMKSRTWKPLELASFRLTNRHCAKVYHCVAATGMPISSGAWRLSVSTPPWRKMTHKSTLTCVTASSTTSWIRLRRWTQTSSPSKPRVPTWSCWSRLKSLIIQMKSVLASMTFTRQTYRAWNGLKPC